MVKSYLEAEEMIRMYRSPMDAPIVITAKKGRGRDVATWVYPDEVERTTKRLEGQGYTITSIREKK